MPMNIACQGWQLGIVQACTQSETQQKGQDCLQFDINPNKYLSKNNAMFTVTLH